MTFDELRLAIAIQKANLGGRDLVTERDRKDAACRIYVEWVNYFDVTTFPFDGDSLDRMRLSLRKNANTQVKVNVAMAHGLQCYFEGRGKGPCSDEAECGHIMAKCNGGPLTVSNCQIECRAHNNQRSSMSIEEYLSSPLTTATN